MESLSLCSCISAPVGPASISSQPTQLRQQKCQKHLCTHVHCTVGVSSLILSIVWSAFTHHTTLSFTPSKLWDNASVRLAKRCKLTYPDWEEQTQAAPSEKDLGIMLPASTLPLLGLGRERNTHNKKHGKRFCKQIAKFCQNTLENRKRLWNKGLIFSAAQMLILA